MLLPTQHSIDSIFMHKESSLLEFTQNMIWFLQKSRNHGFWLNELNKQLRLKIAIFLSRKLLSKWFSRRWKAYDQIFIISHHLIFYGHNFLDIFEIGHLWSEFAYLVTWPSDLVKPGNIGKLSQSMIQLYPLIKILPSLTFGQIWQRKRCLQLPLQKDI